MKIIFEGGKTVIADEFSTDEIVEMNKIGKEVHVADGNIIVEEKDE